MSLKVCTLVTSIILTPSLTILFIEPPLSEIISVLNHESVNLYAETLIKEFGRKFRQDGSTAAGLEVLKEFLKNAGTDTNGMYIEDGSGLSPTNAINAAGLTKLLFYMKNSGKYFREYYASLPDAGKNGTLKSYFNSQIFDSRLKAKSGSMTRVISYAGYITTLSGRQLIFSIIINNFTGPSRPVVNDIEEVIKELIINY